MAGEIPGAATHIKSMDPQSEVVAFLSSPAAHDGAGPVVQHETHGAWVFLAGDHALKIKRSVCFAYMDFSTLEQRHQVLQRELALNRRFAPDLYLAIVSVTRGTDGKLSIDGPGEVVEWALRMRRFAECCQLDAIARRGPLGGDLLKRLADVIVVSHHQSPARRGAGAAARIEKLVSDLGRQLAAECPLLEMARVHAFQETAGDCFERARPVLDRRGEEGFVRRCHGDLHLGNIVLWKGQPTLFDALEFDEDLATIDTLYDLAFLIMDLGHAGHRADANVLLGRYLWRHDQPLDLQGLVALPLFLALRSAIRALVGAQHARQLAADGGEEAQAANGYLVDAARYLEPASARLVAVGGLSGTGKSTLAAALAPGIGVPPGALHLRSDLERKAMLGVGETERLGNEHYTPEVGQRVYERLAHKADLALAAGHSVVVDAVFIEPAQRQAIARVAGRHGLPFHGLWLAAPQPTLVARVETRRGDASDADGAVVERQLSAETGRIDWLTVDASGDPSATLGLARSCLVAAGPGSPAPAA